MKRWLAAVAIAAGGLLAIGCGPSPAYEAEYPAVPPPPPHEPPSAAELQAQANADAQQGEVPIGENADEYADTDPSALTEFKPALEGHGTWVDDSTYGTVWVPSQAEVGNDFEPYVTAGHWSYSDDTDYVWVSDYDWGWAPFHYGRWVHLPGHGWSWIPGRRYAGAWVTWRVGPAGYGYVGWAPAPPAWYWYGGSAVSWSFGWYRPDPYYVYCSHNYFYAPAVHTHVVRGDAGREYYGRTHDYVPASPSVGGGGRVVAAPSVNGRVPATPIVARGPRPEDLGMKRDVVTAPPLGNQGVARAQTYAVPRTAVAAGAAAPTRTVARPYNDNGVVLAPPRRVDPPSSFGPRYEPSARAPSAASLPPQQRAVPEFRPVPRSDSSPSMATPYRPYTSPPSVATPTYRSPPSVATPTYRSPPSVATPTYRSPPSVATPTYRSPPSVSQPSFRSSPSVSQPSFRSSPSVSQPSFRSSPSVSQPSFRSAPTVRSTPSVSAPRAASPTVRAGGSVRRR